MALLAGDVGLDPGDLAPEFADIGFQLLDPERIERQFLEPVARYLAILREWSLERLSDGTGTVPPEQP